MATSMSDIRKELENRMALLQKEIDDLRRHREAIDRKLQEADSKMYALRVVYETESDRWGEPSLPLFVGKRKSYRFAGMKLIEALELLQGENPEIDKKQAHDILVKEGFDFRTKRTLSAVHFAWIGLERKKKAQKARKG